MIKNISKIRLENLRRLIADHPSAKGNRAAFCRAYGLNEAQVGHWFNEFRAIGEKAARKIEDAIGLPPFTLDLDTQNGMIPLWWHGLNIENKKAIESHAIALLAAQKNPQTSTDHKVSTHKDAKKKGQSSNEALVSNGH